MHAGANEGPIEVRPCQSTLMESYVLLMFMSVVVVSHAFIIVVSFLHCYVSSSIVLQYYHFHHGDGLRRCPEYTHHRDEVRLGGLLPTRDQRNCWHYLSHCEW